MDVTDVLKLVNSYNERQDEVFDNMADDIIRQALEKLEKIFNDGRWTYIANSDYLGMIVKVCGSFVSGWKVETEIDWILYEESPKDYDNLIRISEKMVSTEKCSIGGLEGKEAKRIFPLVKALERKGFECYDDLGNPNFVAFVKVKN